MKTTDSQPELTRVRRRPALSWLIISIALLLPVALAAQPTYEVLHHFGPQPSPAYSYSALVQDSSGNFYGTSTQGGNGECSNCGTIFKLEPDGTLTTLHSFQGVPDGGTPYAGLIWDESGNLYGTTSTSGGTGSCGGTVFKLDPSDTLTTLYAFCPFQSGYNLRGSLIRDEAGNLYGTTTYGGLAPNGGHYGIVFKLDPSGAMTTLHVFGSVPNDGFFPRAGLIRDAAGNLYGTTSGLDSEPNGIHYADGTIFRIDAAGTLTTLHSFNRTDGATPFAALIRDDSGNLYGTTAEGGSSDLGTIFRLDNSGVLTTLYAFTGPDGANPRAALIRDDTGNFYGTTANGGDLDGGTVFRLDSLGHFTRLHSFNVAPAEGVHPRAPLILDASGNLVGTTLFGGTNDNGVIFRVNLLAAEPPVITGFSPTVGPSGTDVTISGSGLTGATAVAFNGTPSMSFSTRPSSITATVPPGATTGKIAVTAPGGTAFSATDFTVPGPTITSFTPASGLPGTIVTINGTDFTGVSSVKFNGLIASSFNVLSPTQLTATVLDGTTSGKITVTTPLGTGTSATDFIVLPTITGFFPGSGLPGATVSISGTNFDTATAVAFNGYDATFTIYYRTQITATVPSGATTGKLSVTTPGGTAFSATNFTVLSVPTINSFAPKAGPIGATITINGTGFTGVSSVKFNGKAASFHVYSPTQLTASVSAGTTSGRITVTTPGGTATSATDFTVAYPPTVTGFTPGSGIPGTRIIITGTNFDTANAIAFNTASVPAFTIVSPTQISVKVPDAATTGKIKVTNAAGAASSVAAFLVPPQISSFTPASGNDGTSVTINGKTFNNASSVQFNGIPATFTLNSSTRITATAPSGVTTGKISVTTPGGTTASATNFMVLPKITSFTPTAGPINTKVTINGTGFTGVSSVKFNGKAASFNVLSSTQLTANVSGGTTSGKITVTTSGGTATSATNFIVAVPPTVTGFTPGSGVPGTTVVITGTHFDTATAVAFNTASTTTFTINSPTQITVNVPSAATTGKIKVTNAAGAFSSVASFLVPPTITSFSPTSGRVGTSVIINGKTFTNASSVKINGVAATFTVNTSIRITATVPSSATSGKISVITPGGTAASSTSFTVLP